MGFFRRLFRMDRPKNRRDKYWKYGVSRNAEGRPEYGRYENEPIKIERRELNPEAQREYDAKGKVIGHTEEIHAKDKRKKPK